MPFDRTYTQSPWRAQVYAPAPVTPFTPGGELNYDAYEEIVKFHIEVNRCDSLLVAGDNGEGYVIADDELGRMTERVARVVDGRFRFYVHVSRIATAECIHRAEIAAAAGASGLCLQPHSYLAHTTTAEVVERFEAVTKAVPLPLMLYNSPRHTGLSLTPDQVRAIADVAPVEIFKDGDGDWQHVTDMVGEMGDRFPVISGLALSLVPGLLLGAGGMVSTGPELFGADAKQVFDVFEMTPDERMRTHRRYGAVITAVSFFGTSPSGIKAGLNMLGLPAGVPRAPVKPLEPNAETRLRDTLIANGVRVVESARKAS
ncbi:MAG: dihydrodipicolinate synthase family protein [Rhodospirillales bacterium]|nr:dihydrodipicolinate synthase family protein [Rhodospirillales bacterium]